MATTEKITNAIAMNFFQALSFYYTYCIYPNKSRTHINAWAQINAGVQHFKKICANIAKDDLQYLVTPTT